MMNAVDLLRTLRQELEAKRQQAEREESFASKDYVNRFIYIATQGRRGAFSEAIALIDKALMQYTDA